MTMEYEGRPQWELCRTQEEKDRRTVFMTYKDSITGSAITAEQIGSYVDIHSGLLKPSMNGLSRDNVVKICKELVDNGWFEPDSLARAFLADFEQEDFKKNGDSVASNDNQRTNITDRQQILFEVDPRHVIEISDDDSEDKDDFPSEVCQARIAGRDSSKRPAKTSTRVDQTSGRIQKSNQNAVPAHTKSKFTGKGKVAAQVQAILTKDVRSGRGEISRSEPRRDGTGIPSTRSLSMLYENRPGARPRRLSLANYYLYEPDLPFMPFKLQHKIMTCIQDALEDILFRFAKKWLPMILEKNNWDTPEACELSVWWICLRECQVPVEAVRSVKPGLQKLFDRLKHVRHCAVHRVPDIPIRSIQMMVEDARLLAEALRDDAFIPSFKLWEEALGKIQELVYQSRGQTRVAEAQRKFDSISRERKEVSKKHVDLQNRISVLRQDLSRLEQEREELNDKHGSLCIQEDDAQRILSAEQHTSDSSLAIDDKTSDYAVKVFRLPISTSEIQQKGPQNCFSGHLLDLRDVGRPGFVHPVGRNQESPLDRRLGEQVVSADQAGNTTLPAALNAEVHVQAQACGRLLGANSASQLVKDGGVLFPLNKTGGPENTLRPLRKTSGSVLKSTTSKLEGRIIIDLTTTDEVDDNLSDGGSVIVTRNACKRSRGMGFSSTDAAESPNGVSLKNEYSSADEDDENNDDANKYPSQGTDPRKPNKKTRMSCMVDLQPVRETILGGVVEELGDQDFVPFA